MRLFLTNELGRLSYLLVLLAMIGLIWRSRILRVMPLASGTMSR